VARIFFDFRDPPVDQPRRFTWLERDLPTVYGPSADRPPTDVLETTDGIEILLDVPGIEAEALSVAYRDGAVVIAGHKRPTRCHHHQAAFHLAERTFGRFTRTVTLGTAFDVRNASATLADGELHIVLPRIAERRGRATDIRIVARESTRR
jgi:HSP20 family protein